MKHLYLLFILASSFCYGQEGARLPKSVNIVEKGNMSNSHTISINFEYDEQNRLTSWTDSTYHKNVGGVIAKRNVIKYGAGNTIESITSYEDEKISASQTLSYENDLIKIKTYAGDELIDKYKNPNIIILDSIGRASAFVKNIYSTSTATSLEYSNKGNISLIYTRPASTHKAQSSQMVSTEFVSEVLEHGNKKGIFHDVNMPSWFWLLCSDALENIQHFKNNLQLVKTTCLTMYPSQKVNKSKRKVSSSFDNKGYPILINGIPTNNFSMTVSYY